MTMDRSLIDPEQQVAAWDTIMAAQAPSYDPIQYTSSVESVPANIDIPQQEYVPDAADTYSYASPAPEYQPTYTPGPSLADVTAQEYEQYSAPDFSYQPEQSGSYYSEGTPFDASPVVQYDPSIYQQFGYGGTGEGGLTDQQAADLMFGRTQPEAFFQNPQYAESNAQFDYTTDPANRNGVGILGGLTNVIGAGLTAGTEAASALRALPMTYSVPGAPGQTITTQGNVGQGIDALDLPSDYAAQQTVNLLGDNPYGRTAAAGVNALLDPLTIAGGAVGGAGLAANLVGRGELGLLPYAASSFGAGAASQGAAELGASPGVQMLAGALGGVGGAVAPGLIADAARGLPRGSYGAILGPTGAEDDAARQVMRDLQTVQAAEAPDPVLDAVRAKFLTAAQQETNMRRTGAVGREIRQGRAEQAAGIREAINNGGTLDDIAAATRAGAYQGGTLRKSTLLQPIALSADEQTALVNELGRLVSNGDIGEFDFLRFVMPEDSASPGIIAKLQSETPRLQPAEIKLIRRAMGDEFADAVAKRSAASLEPRMTAAQDRAEAERAIKAEAQQIERAQRQAARLEQQANLRAAKAQERIDDQELRAIQRSIEQAERARVRADELEIAQARRYNAQAEERQLRQIQRLEQQAEMFDQRAMQDIDRFKPTAEGSYAERWAADRLRSDADEIAATRRYNEQAEAKQLRQQAQTIRDDMAASRRLAEHVLEEAPNPEMILRKAIPPEYMPGLSGDNEALTLAKQILDYHLQGNRAILDGLKDAEGWRQYMGAVRAVATGELADSYLTGLMYRNHSLGAALIEGGMDPKVARKVADSIQQMELAKRFPGGIPDRVTNELATMKRAPYDESDGWLRTFVQRWKNTAYSTDFGVIGIQGRAALRRGGVPALAGLINRRLAAWHLPSAAIYDAEVNLPKKIRNILDGVHVGSGSSALRPEAGSMFSYLGPLGKKADKWVIDNALDRMNNFQFDTIMGSIGDMAYEGQLAILHALGRDISNPAVRAQAAEAANAVRSFSNTALRSGRSGFEQIAFTSASMTRAGVSNVLQMAKFLSPTATAEQRIIASTLIASQAVYLLTAGKFLNDQIGITDFVMDPSQYGFGIITTGEKDAQGRNRQIDVVPQASVEKAIARSFRAIMEGNEDEALDAWLRYAAGRESVVGRIPGVVAGHGYTSTGRYSDSLDASERIRSFLPVPPLLQSIAEQTIAGTPDAGSSVLDLFGVSNFPESQYSAEDRYAIEAFGKKYGELLTYEQAQLHAQMAQSGVPIEDWRRAQPFDHADDEAYDLLRAGNELFQMYPDLKTFRDENIKFFMEAGADRQDAQEAVTKMLEDQPNYEAYRDSIRLTVVEQDPETIMALQRLYNDGERLFPPSNKYKEFALKMLATQQPALQVAQ